MMRGLIGFFTLKTSKTTYPNSGRIFIPGEFWVFCGFLAFWWP